MATAITVKKKWVEIPIPFIPTPPTRLVTIHDVGTPSTGIEVYRIVRRDYKRGKIWGMLV